MRNGILLMVIAILTGVFATAYSQDEMTTMDTRAFKNPRRPPVVFHHDAHNEKAGIDDCIECHHKFDDQGRKLEESSEDQSCAECHSLDDADGRPGLIKAFHLNCKGCHLNTRKGPVTCGECHVNGPQTVKK